ncbi:hypothetical protein [Prescottella agglutinans]|uniref:hypothetical protein n=1 Tax=Prescottella agglutinans TaxID=1644129 RepID=UPI0024754C00|nr:hypothetical protein [Prescottella agglutinans]
MTGETEDLEQIVRDMDDAGPGATESKTYRAIVAELEQRRANEKAPDAMEGVEGNETDPNHQEGEDPMATVQAPAVTDALDDVCDPRWAEFAERDREIARILDAANDSHPAADAPQWFSGELPVFDAVIVDEPVRVWERDFAEPSDPFGVRLYAEEVLTGDGLVRSSVEVLVDTSADGLTPEQASALAATISRAVDALEGRNW